jgi:hypothetical protein
MYMKNTPQQKDMIMNDTTVLIVRRSVYGEDKFYPANDLADMLCGVANTKTLPKRVLTTIKDSGLFEVMESLGGIYRVPFTS